MDEVAIEVTVVVVVGIDLMIEQIVLDEISVDVSMYATRSTVVIVSIFTGRNNARGEFKVIVSDLPEGADWRQVKDFLRTGGEVTFCNLENSDTA